MNYKLFPVWTAVEAPALIHCTLEWHMENKTPLQLMVDFRTDAPPAHLIAMDEERLLVHCQGLPRPGKSPHVTYSLLGKSSGGDLLVNGDIHRVSASGDVLTLRIPPRIAVGMPEEYLAIADDQSTIPLHQIPPNSMRTSQRQARNCLASHRIMGNGLCIRRGELNWFSHLRRMA